MSGVRSAFGGTTTSRPPWFSASGSALRRAPSSNMRRIHDAFVRLSVTARETITLLGPPRCSGGADYTMAPSGKERVMKPVPEIYRRLGVRPIIHASGTTTRYGGSILRAEGLDPMRDA